MQPFINALYQMNEAGEKVIVSKTLRTFDEQQKLVDDGKSWTLNSKHLKGLAVDIYNGQNKNGVLQKPSTKQTAIMNAN